MKKDISEEAAIALMVGVMPQEKLEEEATALIEFMLDRGLSPGQGLVVMGKVVEGMGRAFAASGAVQ